MAAPPPRRTSHSNTFSIFNSITKYVTFAFTLSEVLTTLGIIGIIAALTLPALIRKHQDKVTITRVKAAYSIISQAYVRAMEDWGGDISTWDCKVNIAYKNSCLMDKLAKHLNVVSIKKDGSASIDYSLNMKPITEVNRYKKLNYLELSNGFIVKIYSESTQNCEIYKTWTNKAEIEKFACYIIVDINGNQGPNALGRDNFIFKLHKDRVAPFGNATEPYYQRLCKKDQSEYWDGGINGEACAGWILTHDNMDYLHCSGLSFKGKTQCK